MFSTDQRKGKAFRCILVRGLLSLRLPRFLGIGLDFLVARIPNTKITLMWATHPCVSYLSTECPISWSTCCSVNHESSSSVDIFTILHKSNTTPSCSSGCLSSGSLRVWYSSSFFVKPYFGEWITVQMFYSCSVTFSCRLFKPQRH